MATIELSPEEATLENPTYQAYQILHLGFTAAPILFLGALALARLSQTFAR